MKKISYIVTLMLITFLLYSCNNKVDNVRYIVNISVDDGVIILNDIKSDNIYDHNEELTINIKIEEGYEFIGWYVNDKLEHKKFNYNIKVTDDYNINIKTKKTITEKLNSVKNIEYNDDDFKITWDPVDNALSYMVEVRDKETSEVTLKLTKVYETNLKLLNLQSKNNVVYIYAHNKNYIDSNISTLEINIKPKIYNKVYDLEFDEVNDLISWKNNNQKNLFEIKLFNNDDLIYELNDYNLTEFSLNNYDNGFYKLSIKVISDNEIYYESSEEYIYEFELKSKGHLESPDNINIDTGYLSWNYISGTETVIEIYEKDSSELINLISTKDVRVNIIELIDTTNSYKLLIHFESNRHDNKVSTKVTYYIDYEIAYKYSASDIATFSGDVKNKGEHAKATLETLDYKEVPSFSLKFNKKRVVSLTKPTTHFFMLIYL